MKNQLTAGSGAFALAQKSADQIDKRLAEIAHNTKRIADFFEGKRFFRIELSVEVKKEETSFALSEKIPHGYIFIANRVTAQAPEGSRLQIFSNNEAASNFLEVVSNIQEYSEQTNFQVLGPDLLRFVVTKAKVAGTATITVSGELVPRRPTPLGHIP